MTRRIIDFLPIIFKIIDSRRSGPMIEAKRVPNDFREESLPKVEDTMKKSAQ